MVDCDELIRLSEDLTILLGNKVRDALRQSADEIRELRKQLANGDLSNKQQLCNASKPTTFHKELEIRKIPAEDAMAILEPILKCNWTMLASIHGTEWGDDMEFDALAGLVSEAQTKYADIVAKEGR